MTCTAALALRFGSMPDEEMIQRAREGEADAAEFLVDRYRGLVESKARAYFVLGADHEDVVQEGMIGLCKAIRDFREDRLKNFRPFAELCVTRQIITAVKMATRHKHTLLNGSLSLNQAFGGDSNDSTLMDMVPDTNVTDPGQALCDAQFQGRLNRLVEESLSDLERSVLTRYLDGKSYQEMSDELNCHTKSIDNALQRVKKKINGLIQAMAN